MADKKELMKDGEEVVKKRGRGGTENFPATIPSSTKKEDVQRIMSNVLRWYKCPKVTDDDDCEKRLLEFFIGCAETGEIPTHEKMCLALGYDRKTVWQWETGVLQSSRRQDLIKKAKELLASFDAEMVTEGKINPVTYIFRAKNYFGMKDVQDMVLTPNVNPLGDIKDPDEIAKRYALGVAVEED